MLARPDFLRWYSELLIGGGLLAVVIVAVVAAVSVVVVVAESIAGTFFASKKGVCFRLLDGCILASNEQW